MSLKILTICGSLRKTSFNKLLLDTAASIAQKHGAEIIPLNPDFFNLPAYNEDLDIPGKVPLKDALKSSIQSADIIMIASPEYNFSIPGGLKNVIDWASRTGNSFSGKWAIIMGASTGIFGSLRGQFHLRQCLEQMNVMMLPTPAIYVRSAKDAFSPEGKLSDPKTLESLETLIKSTIEHISKLRIN